MKISKLLLLSVSASVITLGAASCQHQTTDTKQQMNTASSPDMAEHKSAHMDKKHKKYKKLKTMFAKKDINQDGMISAAEHDELHVVKFAKLDADNSGTFSVEEFLAPGMKAAADKAAKQKKKQNYKKNKFAKIDADKSGEVSQDEFLGFASKMFTKADTSADGNVSFSEFKARKKAQKMMMKKIAKMKAKFSRLDANSDRAISLNEYENAHLKPFLSRDLDNNGEISEAECDTARQGWSEEKIAKAKKHRAKVDANSDGVVTRDEFLGKARASFAKGDSNADGAINWGEFYKKYKGKKKHKKHKK